MGKLDDLSRKLYQPDYSGKSPLVQAPSGHAVSNAPTAWTETAVSPEHSWRSSRYLKAALGVFLLGAIGLITVLYFGLKEQDLTLSVRAKEQAESGEKITYEITYRNRGSQTLRDVELTFTYPTGAVPLREEGTAGKIQRSEIALDDIPAGGEAKLELEARVFGKTGDAARAEAVLSYRPEKSTTAFSARSIFETRIVRVPLALSLSLPNDVVSGQDVDLVIDYSMSGESAFEDISLGVDYPPGFIFISSSKPAIEGNRIWPLGTLSPGDSGKITVHGRIEGSPGAIQAFNSEIGRYDRVAREWNSFQTASISTKILTPLLSVVQTMNGTRTPILAPGDIVEVDLHYKNTLDIPLKSVVITVKLASPLVDVRSISVTDGAFNGATQSIIWNAASASELGLLAAHAEGDLHFSFRLLQAISGTDLKNLVITSRATIRSSDSPSGLQGVDLSSEDTLTAKISTKLTLSSRLLYHSPSLRTSGPLPPKVGKKTTYAVLWQLSNSFNNLEGVEVRAKLAPTASWENVVAPSGGPISYDPASGQILWRVGALAAGEGIGTAPPFITFLVGIVPAENMIGRSPPLVQEVAVTAKDTFTGQSLNLTSEDLTSNLSSDPTTVEKDWLVIP